MACPIAEAIKVIRSADAAISDQALESEFRLWWRQTQLADQPPDAELLATSLAWGRHLLSRGEPMNARLRC